MTQLKEQQKLLLLERIVKLYVKITRDYNEISVNTIMKDKINVSKETKTKNAYGELETTQEIEIVKIPLTKFVKVSYYDTKISTYESYSIEFPITHLSKRIAHYKQKLRTAFKNRHKTK